VSPVRSVHWCAARVELECSHKQPRSGGPSMIVCTSVQLVAQGAVNGSRRARGYSATAILNRTQPAPHRHHLLSGSGPDVRWLWAGPARGRTLVSGVAAGHGGGLSDRGTRMRVWRRRLMGKFEPAGVPLSRLPDVFEGSPQHEVDDLAVRRLEQSAGSQAGAPCANSCLAAPRRRAVRRPRL